MEWTKPLAAILVALIVLLVIGAVVELVLLTLADPQRNIASAVTLALVVVVVTGLVGVGARSKRWLANPDDYW